MNAPAAPSLRHGRLSVIGLVSLTLGVAMLVGFRTVQDHFSEAWSDAWTVAWLVIAALASLWGANALLEQWNPFGNSKLDAVARRNRIHVPRPGLVYLVMMAVMLVGSLLGRSNMLMLMFALMAGPFVINGWITYSMLRRLRVSRQAPRAVMAGEPANIDVLLENRKLLLSCWVMSVRDRVTNGEETLEPETLFIHVPPRRRRIASYTIRLRRRGRYQLGPLHVVSRFPLGLVERGLTIPSPGEILVYPHVGRIASQWRRANLLSSELVDRRKLRRGVFDDEFHAIREFRAGDNPKAIHWRTSARQTQLMVREYHQSREPNLLVLVDLWLGAVQRPEDLLRVELAVSFAATLCVEQMRHSRDARLELALAGTSLQRWEGRSGPASAESLLEMLAVAQPSERTDLASLRRLSTERPPATTRVLLVTTRPVVGAGRGFHKDWSQALKGDADSAGEILIVEADPERMAAIFSLDEAAEAENDADSNGPSGDDAGPVGTAAEAAADQVSGERPVGNRAVGGTR